MYHQSFTEEQALTGSAGEVGKLIFAANISAIDTSLKQKSKEQKRETILQKFFNHLHEPTTPCFKTKICGHLVPKNQLHRPIAFDKEHVFIVDWERFPIELVRKSIHLNYCPDCFAQMAIKCPFCEEIIFIGDAISFYNLSDEEISRIHEFDTVCNGSLIFDQEKKQIVTCKKCGNQELDAEYLWAYPGRVYKSLCLVEISGCASFYPEYAKV